MIRGLTLGVGILLLACSIASAQAISVGQTIDKAEVAFEDSVRFEITLQWSGPQTAFLFDRAIRPNFDRFKTGNFSSTVSSTGSGPDQITTKKLVYTLVPQLSGLSEIRPLTIDYLAWPDSTSGQLVTEAMAVNILDPVRRDAAEETMSIGLVAGLALLAIVLIGSAIFIIIRKRAPKEPVRSPVELFLSGLNSLKSESGNDLKRFQTGLFALVAEFATGHYGIDQSGHTGQQLADLIVEKEPVSGVSETLSGWLLEAERQKFSPVAAAPGEVLRHEAEIRSYFEKNFLK